MQEVATARAALCARYGQTASSRRPEACIASKREISNKTRNLFAAKRPSSALRGFASSERLRLGIIRAFRTSATADHASRKQKARGPCGRISSEESDVSLRGYRQFHGPSKTTPAGILHELHGFVSASRGLRWPLYFPSRIKGEECFVSTRNNLCGALTMAALRSKTQGAARVTAAGFGGLMSYLPALDDKDLVGEGMQ